MQSKHGNGTHGDTGHRLASREDGSLGGRVVRVEIGENFEDGCSHVEG